MFQICHGGGNVRYQCSIFILILVMIVLYSFFLQTIWNDKKNDKNFVLKQQQQLNRDNAIELNVRNQTGLWIGNTWIPPNHWKYHTPEELQTLYHGKHILWIGDSTGRRACMTLYALLEWSTTTTPAITTTSSNNSSSATERNFSSFLPQDLSNPALLDITKLIHNNNHYFDDNNDNTNTTASQCPERNEGFTICRSLTGGGSLLYLPMACHHDIAAFFQQQQQQQQEQENETQSNLTHGIDLIIIAVGIWEILRHSVCGEINRTIEQVTIDTIHSIQQYQQWQFQQQQQEYGMGSSSSSIPTIIWRTSGYSEHGPILSNAVTDLNEIVMDVMDQQLHAYNTTTSTSTTDSFGKYRFSYVDWGGAVQSRSQPGQRIQGDMKAHYGIEPRLVLIEMITNHLQDIGFF